MKTYSEGKFRIQTIRPGIYLDENGSKVPSHIHFTLSVEGYWMYASEFTFEDVALILENGNLENVPVTRLSTPKPIRTYCVDIMMQKGCG